jgi:lipoyl(octanoyl) transferase
MKFEKLRLIQDQMPRIAAENMAIDEALFLTADSPVIRFYRWARPSVSFGYFTAWSEVYQQFAERDLVRRWTGGGIVEHGRDLTYSLVCPGRRAFPVTTEFYRLVHAAVARAFAGIGCSVEVAQVNEAGASKACFDQAVQYDLKFEDVKIAGAAIRRNRKGLLLQGSIQRVEIPPQFELMFARELAEQLDSGVLSSGILGYANCIMKDKYGAAEWNRRS